MKDLTTLKKINQVIASFFEKNTSITKIRAKELMPYFIAAGIFLHDHRGGFPIRKILRELDENNELHLIPCVLSERKTKNTNWYF
jgi:hypothetical protein